MVKTASTMQDLGTKAPDFKLKDSISDKSIGLHDFKDKKATVIMFICNHCPYVKHISNGISELAKKYQEKEVGFIAINSNDINNYPDDSPENMKKTAEENDYRFPYLFDSTQEVAKAYGAACTPDFFIYDADFKLVYRGQFDDSRPGNDVPVTGQSIRNTLDNILENKPIDAMQKASLGCNIKWKE